MRFLICILLAGLVQSCNNVNEQKEPLRQLTNCNWTLATIFITTILTIFSGRQAGILLQEPRKPTSWTLLSPWYRGTSFRYQA